MPIPDLMALAILAGFYLYVVYMLFQPRWLRAVFYRRGRSRRLQVFVRDKLVMRARERVCVFAPMLHTITSDSTLATWLMQTQVPVRLLIGPEVDVSAVPLLRAIATNRNVLFHLADPAKVTVKTQGDVFVWKYQHFCVVDGKHLCVVDEHTRASDYTFVPGSRELQNYPSIALTLEARFDELVNEVGQRFDRTSIFDFIMAHGRWVVTRRGVVSLADYTQIQRVRQELDAPEQTSLLPDELHAPPSV